MTNKEKFREEIEDIIFSGENFAISKNEVVECHNVPCTNCLFNGWQRVRCCVEARQEWLKEEYKEPTVDWSKVKVDTPVLVQYFFSSNWYRRYFAKYENGKVYVFPYGQTSWAFVANDIYLEECERAKLAESEE